MKHSRLALILAVIAPFIASAAEPAEPTTAPAKPDAATAFRPSGQKREYRDVAYAIVGETKLLLDAYLPGKADKLAPVVVWIHGGGWVGGDKRPCPARLLLPQGYAVFSINYRLATEAPWPAQIHDCKAAIRWLRANAAALGIDPDRIGVWGASAGGHLAALLGTTAGDKELEGDGGNAARSSRVQAVCDWFGPTDLARIVLARADAPAAGPVIKLLGDPNSDLSQVAKQASPVSHVSKDDAPFLIVHGDRDRLVPLEQSQLLQQALAKAGVESTLHVVKGAGHGFAGKDVAAMVKQFFDKHLKGAEDDKKP